MRALALALTFATGCSVALPIAAASTEAQPDRTPQQDRIALAIAFGIVIDSTIIGAIYGIRRLSK